MPNPERGEVKLGDYVIKFSFSKLRQLESELGLESYGEIFAQFGNLKSLTTIIAIGAGIDESQVEKIDVPIVNMAELVLKALSLAIFGTPEPPKADDPS